MIQLRLDVSGLAVVLASLSMIEVDPAACQIVSTVTRVGRSIYDEGAHGEAGAKDGVTFEATTMQCNGGALVNASPPYGLQALE